MGLIFSLWHGLPIVNKFGLWRLERPLLISNILKINKMLSLPTWFIKLWLDCDFPLVVTEHTTTKSILCLLLFYHQLHSVRSQLQLLLSLASLSLLRFFFLLRLWLLFCCLLHQTHYVSWRQHLNRWSSFVCYDVQCLRFLNVGGFCLPYLRLHDVVNHAVVQLFLRIY